LMSSRATENYHFEIAKLVIQWISHLISQPIKSFILVKIAHKTCLYFTYNEEELVNFFVSSTLHILVEIIVRNAGEWATRW